MRVSKIVVSLLLLSFYNVWAGEPYAIKPDLSGGGANGSVTNSYIAISIEKATSPDKAAISVPQYPGASLISSFAGISKSPGKYERLPYIELISQDAYDKVLSFYEGRLKGWQRGGLNTAVYFAEKGMVNIFKPESTHVGIHDVTKYYREKEQQDLQTIVPGAKTLIKIFYEAK